VNQRGVDALLAAEAAGVRQIKGRTSDGKGGRCAVGVLIESWAHEVGETYDSATGFCIACIASRDEVESGTLRFDRFYDLGARGRRNLAYANDAGLTFRQVAEKYGPKDVTPIPPLQPKPAGLELVG
jgi:hypothetical protein